MLDFPTLTFLPVEHLLIHEFHDEQRVRPLLLRIRASGVFRNPPIVSPLRDGTPRYMVLDGANRVTALREMGYPHALVHVVEPDDPGLELQTWNHVVWELNPARFLTGIGHIPGVRLQRAGAALPEPVLEGDCGLAVVQTCKGRAYALCSAHHGLESRVGLLRAIVASYQSRSRLDRTSAREVSSLVGAYPSLSGLVIFPRFAIWDLLRLVSQGYLLPAGVTRFMIAPRVLHLNYPLEELAVDRPLDAKNQALQRWIQDHLAHKGVRYYAEPTYLFDE
jgi:L-serine kinase (ATP) / ParB family transcriptional regulator, heme-responsive regulator